MALSLFEDAPAQKPVAANTAPWKRSACVTLYLGDCMEILGRMPVNSVDSGITDPPYGIGFMGKEWDTFEPESVAVNTRKAFRQNHGTSTNPNVIGRQRSPAMSPSQIEYDRTLIGQRGFQKFTEDWAREILRVLKPGAHLLVCGAPRSAHRMVCGLEDAGFEIRDSFAWLFGQGFPKSHNLDNGWGTALKPGHEPIVLARKPFAGTVEEKVEVWGTGALNINGCRLGADGLHEVTQGGNRQLAFGMKESTYEVPDGRWPANVLLDQQAGSLLDQQAGERTSGANPTHRQSDKFRKVFGKFKGQEACTPARGAESGGASRFFFVAKPSRAERDFGCEDLPVRTPGECTKRTEGSAGITPYAGAGRSGGGRNFHPTVKPVALMRWLIRLVTPPGGVVLDPFLGSGTTGMAALLEGCEFVGIDQEADYLGVADARMSAVARELGMELKA